MGRFAHGCAIAVAATVLAATSPAGANTITTVAGGGAVTPLDYQHYGSTDPLTYLLPSPQGIAWSGAASGLYYVVLGDGKCVQLWQEFNPASNSFGMAIEGGSWETCGVQIGGYPSPVPAYRARLDNPCCVTSNWQWDPAEQDGSVGPLVASSGSGHIDFYSWPYVDNTGQTVAGSTSPADCNATNLTPVDGVAATSAQFCEINGLAQQYTAPYNYAIAEHNRGPSTGVISFIDRTGTPTVHFVAKTSDSSAPFKFGPLAWDRSGRLLVSDRESGIWLITPDGSGGWNPPTRIAGQSGGQGGFTGDGQPATQANFANVQGLAVGFDDALYIADADNCRIRKIDDVSLAPASTTVSTIAGDGCNPDTPLGDGGPSTAGNLDHPVGVAISPIGLLISDTGHNRIRLIDRTSIIDPPAITADNAPTFDIRSLDTPAHIKCNVDTVDVECNAIGPLLDGPHTLLAWENGNAANQPDPPDPTPAQANFTVDTTGPANVSLVSPADKAVGVPVDTGFSWSAGSDDYAGIDHYELWIDGAKDSDVPTNACHDGTCVAKSAKLLAAGARSWQIRAVDKLGNTTPTPTRSLTAGGPPKALFSIGPNPALAGRTVTFDASASSDESGIARYEWDLDGDGLFETDAHGSPTTSRVYPAPASVTIRLRVTDGTGDQSTTEHTLKITEPAGQNLLGISINSGAQYTHDPHVALLVKAPETASAVLVSNDGGFLAPSTFPVASTVPWTLDSSGPERLPKTVYVRFLLGPIISETYTDDIILDEIPPVVQSASLTAPGLRRSTATAATAATYLVKVKATDSNSGVGHVQIAANKKKPGKLLAYKTKIALKSAQRPKFVRAQDRAGNFSSWKSLR